LRVEGIGVRGYVGVDVGYDFGIKSSCFVFRVSVSCVRFRVGYGFQRSGCGVHVGVDVGHAVAPRACCVVALAHLHRAVPSEAT
jgi:hypothetical protein